MALRGLALAAALVALLAPAAFAASSISLSFVPNPDAVGQEVDVQLHLSLDSSFNGGHFDVKYKPAGGTCAATPDADTGTVAQPNEPTSYVDASYKIADVFATPPLGKQLFCAWVTDDTTMQVAASTQATLDVLPRSSGRVNIPTDACKALTKPEVTKAMHSRISLFSPASPGGTGRFELQTWSGCQWEGPQPRTGPASQMSLNLMPAPGKASLAKGFSETGGRPTRCKPVRGVGSGACFTTNSTAYVDDFYIAAVKNRLFFTIRLTISKASHSESNAAGLAALKALAKKVISRVSFAHSS